MSFLIDGWLESASGDLQNIEYIIKDKNLTHIVAFHSQQCVEKSFKAGYSQHMISKVLGLSQPTVNGIIKRTILSLSPDPYNAYNVILTPII